MPSKYMIQAAGEAVEEEDAEEAVEEEAAEEAVEEEVYLYRMIWLLFDTLELYTVFTVILFMYATYIFLQIYLKSKYIRILHMHGNLTH